MKKTAIILLSIFLNFALFTTGYAQKPKFTFVKIYTSLGDMKIKLYNETPLHRDNFIKLAKEHFYDSLLFHRVIKDFMIQTGDPQSKHATSGEMLGNGDPGYTIPAEILPQLIHKKGALAAARTPDNVNPEKRSSGSQFYIVQGKPLTDDEIRKSEEKITNSFRQSAGNNVIKHYTDSLKYYITARDSTRWITLRKKAIGEAQAAAIAVPSYTMPTDLKTSYQTIGGTPWLDGEYTIFGGVVEGLDVIDKIAAVETDSNNRPASNIRIRVEIIK